MDWPHHLFGYRKDLQLTRRRHLLVVTMLILIGCSSASAEVTIGHFFPDRELLLGQSLIWTVRLTHPAEESYQLKITPCPGADIQVEERRIDYLYEGKVQVLYSLRVTPLSLEIPEVPSIVIFDERGQSKVWNGNPLRVLSISGNSMEIRQPRALLPLPERKGTGLGLLFPVPVLLIAGAYLVLRRRWEKLPRQLYAKDLRKALAEIQKDRLPVQTWRLLRSHWIWGSNVESFTSAQLKDTARGDVRLTAISDTLAALESWKYGGEFDSWNRGSVEDSIHLALDILKDRKTGNFLSSFRRNA